MTYVMKVPVQNDMIYSVSRQAPKIIKVLQDKDPWPWGYSIYRSAKIYNFTDEFKADMFYHIVKQIIMYQRYEEHDAIWGDYLWNGGSYRQDYNKLKQQQPEEFIYYNPDDQKYKDMITELDLTPESKPEQSFHNIAILGPKYSYVFILDKDRCLWCLGWNNADIGWAKIPFRLKPVNPYDDFIEHIPDMLSKCALLNNIDESCIQELDEIMPNFSGYRQSIDTYPYDNLPRTYKWKIKFIEWYKKCSCICMNRKDCFHAYYIGDTRIQGTVCRNNRRMIECGGFDADFQDSVNYDTFRNYTKIVSRSNRIEKYRHDHQITR